MDCGRSGEGATLTPTSTTVTLGSDVMATLTHEIWEDGDGLPSCCLAGPMGDGMRKLLGTGARLVRTFQAASHFDAMTTYNATLGRGPYVTDQARDRDPYPDDWLSIQTRTSASP